MGYREDDNGGCWPVAVITSILVSFLWQLQLAKSQGLGWQLAVCFLFGRLASDSDVIHTIPLSSYHRGYGSLIQNPDQHRGQLHNPTKMTIG